MATQRTGPRQHADRNVSDYSHILLVMRRGFLILLTSLMLVQSTWAALAVCCRDEAMRTGSAIAQLHNPQYVSAEAGSPLAMPLNAEPSHPGEVCHCHCHHACAALGAALDLDLDFGPRAPPLANLLASGKSHIPDGLDRPNWLRA